MKKKTLFLIATSFSTFGDTLMLFAVPSGLGLETNDIRSAVFMWLIPAIAIFGSTFLGRRVARRLKSARTDYATVLVSLGLLEITIALLATVFTSKTEILILVSLFTFVYAFAKEGLPRLLYTNSVYKYFVDDNQYANLAGTAAGLGVLASLAGILFASQLVSSSSWRISLAVDAATFIVLGYVIYRHGRDPSPVPNQSQTVQTENPIALNSNLRLILFSVPLLFGINALVGNYLPLIAARFGIGSVATTLGLIALLRLPGILSGLSMTKISRAISYRQIVVLIPALLIASTYLFVWLPNLVTLCAIIAVHGLVAGLYWPADTTLRNALRPNELIRFNTTVVRRFALVQLFACLIALYIYRPSSSLQLEASLATSLVVVLAFFSARSKVITR